MDRIGGWPVINASWNETKWNWTEAITILRSVNQNGSTQFKIRTSNAQDNEVDNFESTDLKAVEEAYSTFITTVVELVMPDYDKDIVKKEIQDLIEFEQEVDLFERKFRAYIKRSLNGTSKSSKKLKKFRENIIWLNEFGKGIFANSSSYEGNIEFDLKSKYTEFLKKTPSRFDSL